MKQVALPALGLALAFNAWSNADARADHLLLKDGQIIEGRVIEHEAGVDVALDFGTITFAKSEIQEIRRASTPLEELEHKKKTIAKDNVDSRRQLARWAEAHGLESQARSLYRQVLELSPNDEEAHRTLGDHKVDSKWLSEDEYMRSRGFVRYGGAWKSLDEVRALEAEAAARKQARKSEERIRKLEAEVQALEEKAEVDRREREERELERSYWGTGYWGGGYWGTGWLYGQGWGSPWYRANRWPPYSTHSRLGVQVPYRGLYRHLGNGGLYRPVGNGGLSRHPR